MKNGRISSLGDIGRRVFQLGNDTAIASTSLPPASGAAVTDFQSLKAAIESGASSVTIGASFAVEDTITITSSVSISGTGNAVLGCPTSLVSAFVIEYVSFEPFSGIHHVQMQCRSRHLYEFSFS